MRQFSIILAILASVILTDAHWFVMQSIAWVDMSIDASHSDEVSLEDVFTGRILCTQCKVIAKGKKNQKDHTVEVLAQGRTLAPIAVESLSIPPRSWERMIWPRDVCLIPSQFDEGVVLPPPQV